MASVDVKPTIRSSNWEPREKDYLLQLISEQIKIIENKECDKSSKKKKDSAWAAVHLGFTSKFGSIRDLKQIKEQWKRMKLAAKREFALQKPGQTGGGPPAPLPSAMSLAIKELVPQDFLQMCNSYDDDGTMSLPAGTQLAPTDFLNSQGFQPGTVDDDKEK
ncbi:uncharacterized protein [Amphiura filiformis]|uniref:uncharacterized protein n=1 Tax=Amphiura filiformis TaxID=82378 RepID=UPI003B2250A1